MQEEPKDYKTNIATSRKGLDNTIGKHKLNHQRHNANWMIPTITYQTPKVQYNKKFSYCVINLNNEIEIEN